MKAVMQERAKFIVHLVGYEMNLIKAPGKQNDFLPRYHRVIFEIKKQEATQLDILTVKMLRLGSKIGEDNVEYLTIPVSDIPAGTSVKRESYLFDPYNLPFESMRLEFKPDIDLSSKMVVKYKEIQRLL